MRKATLFLLTAVALLSAVQWREKLITDDPSHYYVMPLLTLDNQGYAHILYLDIYEDWDEDTAFYSLRMASNKTGRWVSEEVTQLSSEYSWFIDLDMPTPYDFDIDGKGNAYVTFFDFLTEEEPKLFLATDSSGSFVVDMLTDNDNIQVWPMLEIDKDDKVKLVYVEGVMEQEEPVGIYFCYGWFEDGVFYSQNVWNLGEDIEGYPMDMILGKDGYPFVFYTDDDYVLQRIYRSSSGWQQERLTDTTEGYMPSACIDPEGNLCFTYLTSEDEADIYFVRKDGADWRSELVADSIDFDWYLSSSLAFNPDSIAYLVWSHMNEDWYYDLYLGTRVDSGWVREQITNTPYTDEVFGTGHDFVIDGEGYGHITYMLCGDYSETMQIIYAKSKEPLKLEEGIVENPELIDEVDLAMRDGSVRFSLSEPGIVQLDLFDACGRRVARVTSGFYPAGEHSEPLNLQGLARGAYFLQLTACTRKVSTKFILTD
ncbi:T9SS type A sorting domain-containing protein [candidate division WOR-3 bacterium]|nr:T9SS type A sorting domain-containing protein [candidate division WOR-3 bacterium]